MPDNRPDPPVDPRGVRFAAAVTTIVLALVLVTGSVWRLAAQVAGQAVGFVFAAVGLVGCTTGLTALGIAATALALAAGFLNAAFGLRLGGELYGLIARLRTTSIKGVSA